MAHETHRMLFKAQRPPLVSPAATRRGRHSLWGFAR